MKVKSYFRLKKEDGKMNVTKYYGNECVIKLPNNVNGISDGLFMNNLDINSVKFPDSIHTIGKSAFEGCENLSLINLFDFNDEIEYIGENAFKNCKSLCTNLYNEVPICDITISGKNITIGKHAFKDCKNIRRVTFCLGAIKSSNNFYSLNIGPEAFAGCTNLEKVNFIYPEQFMDSILIKIDDGAFSICPKLNKIEVPSVYCLSGLYDPSVCRIVTISKNPDIEFTLSNTGGLIVKTNDTSGSIYPNIRMFYSDYYEYIMKIIK